MLDAPPSKYFRGIYALCAVCGCKPCVCVSAPAVSAHVPAVRRTPASGNAIPFIVWDVLIAEKELSIFESGVLLYLCRMTHGYGQHGGTCLSIAEIAGALRISRSAATRALTRLAEFGLIERTQRREEGRYEYARSHFRVVLERE